MSIASVRLDTVVKTTAPTTHIDLSEISDDNDDDVIQVKPVR
jgi:hypothetical protein